MPDACLTGIILSIATYQPQSFYHPPPALTLHGAKAPDGMNGNVTLTADLC